MGYQARGTPGAVIQASSGADRTAWVELDQVRYEIRAKVMTLEGYSAHADQAGLVRFALGQGQPVRRVVLVHGEGRAKQALARALRLRYEELGYEVDVTIP